MFIAVYEFKIKTGTDKKFRRAWLDVTQAIYKYCASYGSRLHATDQSAVYVGYAQWPDKKQWSAEHQITAPVYVSAREEMRQCLLSVKTVYELEVTDDYLQTQPYQSV